MFHVKQVPDEFRDAVQSLFAVREPLAQQYHDFLATAGVERGVVGPREVDRLWERHILNSAAIESVIDDSMTVVDVGSGGGLPGIPLAIARPDLSVTLVEPMLRRTEFMEECQQESGLAIRIVRGRAEDANVLKQAGGADVATSRAVAPLLKLLRWSLPLVRPGGEVIAIKGASVHDEIARDAKGFKKLGVVDGEVQQCGSDILETPTTVVRIRKANRQRRRTEQNRN
ncbi:16S rRNA (guanine(527)-N(7))-methyltransferase RsmG [Hoyosella sp. G463]|uniref:Ribosomal RNA small subunit methyltransferase G n=1 Tax=Lolliginicoccus lacisalsi TaxID=2742202 RepID=A0A927JEQ9_9ACTN|nr:16S rRNA (guanine(527)-N(7))-methyltransferase RsmG [Lolliginicoccus lacisalsi]MBD8507027.1 16S rRNA (guanine(527)-N(7))-methyltransferase RsmG [Lolliginicoccus lacisalsi]